MISHLMVSNPHQGRIAKCPRWGFLLSTRKITWPVWSMISNYWQVSVQQQQLNTVFSTTFPTYRYWYLTWTVGLSSKLRQQLLLRKPSQGVCWQQSNPVMLQDLWEAGKMNRCISPTYYCRVRYTSPSSSQSSSVEMSSYSLGRSQGMKGRPTGRGKGRAQLQYLRGSDFWLSMKNRCSLSPLQSNIINIINNRSQLPKEVKYPSLKVLVDIRESVIFVLILVEDRMERIEESEEKRETSDQLRLNEMEEYHVQPENEQVCGTRVWMRVVKIMFFLVIVMAALQYYVDSGSSDLKEVELELQEIEKTKIIAEKVSPNVTNKKIQNSTIQTTPKEVKEINPKPIFPEPSTAYTGTGEVHEFKKILWVQTDDELAAKKMEIAVSAQNIIHFAELAGYEIRIVDNINAYQWLSKQMVAFIKETHQKSKFDLPVFELLRLALLIEHGGVSVRLPELLLMDSISWVEEVFTRGKIVSQQREVLSCHDRDIEVLMHHQNDRDFKYSDDFIAARKQSTLLIKIIKEISSIVINGIWPYTDDNIVSVNPDTLAVTLPGVSSTLTNRYLDEIRGRGTLCQKYRLQSFDQNRGIFMKVAPKMTASALMLQNEEKFIFQNGKKYMLRLNMAELVNDIVNVIKSGDLEQGGRNSLLKNKLMMAKGNQWLTKPKEKVRKVHLCIISLKTQNIKDYKQQVLDQLSRLEKQSYKAWNSVFFIDKFSQVYQNMTEKAVLVNASIYEGLNLQRAATKYCQPNSVGFILNYDENLSKASDFQTIADQFANTQVFGAFVNLQTLKQTKKPNIAGEIRRKTYVPNVYLLETIGNNFRLFTIESYRFISHIDLRHSSGRYFDREIPFLSMLEIASHFAPCEKGNIVYQIRRLEEHMTIPKKRLQLDITIQTNNIKSVNMRNYENFGKLRYRHLCGTVQFYQEYVAPVETMAVFNDGYEYEGIQARKGKPQVIPKRIHQIWVRGEIPQFKKFLMDRLRDAHPDYEYYIWSQANITRENFPEGYDLMQTLIEWDKKSPYNKMSVVSDIMRSEIVYNYGGFYLDTNYMLFKEHALGQFLTYNFVTAGQLSQRQRFFRDTAIFGAIQHSPRIGRLITHKALSSRNFYSKRAAKEAGPGLFGKTLLGKQEQDPEVFQPGFEQFYPNFIYDPGNYNKNRCEASHGTPAKDILFTSSRSYLKKCDQIYPYAFGLDFFAEGLSWQKRRW